MKKSIFIDKKNDDCIALIPVDTQSLDKLESIITQAQLCYIKQVGFTAKAKTFISLPESNGQVRTILWGVEGLSQLALLGYVGRLLPDGHYYLDDRFDLVSSSELVYLGYALGRYQFIQYHTAKKEKKVKLYWALKDQDANVIKQAYATYFVRDLINTPAQDMTPEILAKAAENLANEFGATYTCISGDQLLKENYPLVHAVGRASKHTPQYVKLTWGAENNPHIALVGKGVCYDTGGLSLKPTSGMKLMKKDMGGAAQTLGLMRLIMDYQLPVRLTVLIPMVENAIGGDAFRLGDVFCARNGKSIEILNTDAEGRLVLADALSEASESDAELIIDFATLTGASRIALGMDIGALYSNDASLAKSIAIHSEVVEDLVWHMPLFAPYKKGLQGRVAELNNMSSSPYGGAIAAALFLQAFIGDKTWAHFDISGWRDTDQPISEIGGDAMGMRAVFGYLCSRYA